jgi:predicted nuclease with TOPRIM domain
MNSIQEIFSKIKEKQKEQKLIKSLYRDALANSQEYQGVIEDIKSLKDKKKKIEENLKDELSSEMEKLYSIKVDIESDKELLSQATLTKILKGEEIEITDEYNNKYEPIFNVRFKKF